MGFIPITISAGQNPLVQFDGKIQTQFLEPPPGTAFQIMQTYKALKKEDRSGAYRGPPPHFHVHQTERFKVLKGRIGVEINEEVRILRPGDEVAVCPAGNIHRFFVDTGDVSLTDQEKKDWDGESILMVNATDSGKDFVLDRIFLENWYGIRVDSFKFGNKIDFIQQCCTFDGGDHYLPFPSNLPNFISKPWSVWIRTFLGYWITILVGRWVGGLLGYQPYYREYTTDWELAVAKMSQTWFYRKNVHTAYRAASSWAKLQQMTPFSDNGAAQMGLDGLPGAKKTT
ncbi:uncharacterized protein N7484_001804 [Penicillium longicatenatum]|uniref:uncharacterized protein n=1 Tax=Penicillium longicatenatum TaxID=1561947 RepID=UPI0025465E0E|nr:uncharacterized protein N7484_001804 [Penicillium longicatenatum]KAJ5658155.1 hypothetical protein N7484_001804 [Penicillium longicatenatum]